jgi:hypothetical protein
LPIFHAPFSAHLCYNLPYETDPIALLQHSAPKRASLAFPKALNAITRVFSHSLTDSRFEKRLFFYFKEQTMKQRRISTLSY